ncbi:MAG: chaperonin GroEL [Erysipelotrichaceae bacterium]|nr:chaperonin GroEL [Erysipelotrichaceae bacterium]
MKRTVCFQKEARDQLLKGAYTLMESVKGTLGPCGHHVVLQRSLGAPLVTNDGVTIAKAIHCENPYEQMGVQILLDSAIKTNETSGDGTTTSILLAYEMLKNGFSYMASGGIANAYVEGMEMAAHFIEQYLREHCLQVDTFERIAQIATISAKSDEIGTLVAQALKEVGDPHCIVCESGRSYESKIRIQKGMELSASVMSPYFFHKDETTIICKHPFLFISNERIESQTQIEHFLAYAINAHRPLIILCEDMESDVLAALLLAHMQKICQVIVCKAPSFGTYQQDMLEDLALVCGATVCSADFHRDLQDISIDELGQAKEVILHKHSIQVLTAHKIETKEKIKNLEKQLETELSTYDRKHIHQRIARLEGKMAILEIGGYTKGEIEEKKMRLEDALQASFAAMEEGVVPGGGLALIQAYKTCLPMMHGVPKDVESGMSCVFAAILKPFLQLMENNYEQPVEMLEIQLGKADSIGYDVWKKTWCNLSENGILDPLKVVVQALHNAVSVSSLLIRCDAAVLLAQND